MGIQAQRAGDVGLGLRLKAYVADYFARSRVTVADGKCGGGGGYRAVPWKGLECADLPDPPPSLVRGQRTHAGSGRELGGRRTLSRLNDDM